MAGGDLAIDAVLIICAIAGERGDGTVNLVKQRTDLRAVIDIVGSQRRRDDPTSVGINTDVESPATRRGSTVVAGRGVRS